MLELPPDRKPPAPAGRGLGVGATRSPKAAVARKPTTPSEHRVKFALTLFLRRETASWDTPCMVDDLLCVKCSKPILPTDDRSTVKQVDACTMAVEHVTYHSACWDQRTGEER
jgi:hypothetical protein